MIDEARFRRIAEILVADDWYLKNHEYRFRRTISQVLESCGASQGRLLDIGCWPGHLPLYFKFSGWDVSAIDLKPERLGAVTRNGIGVVSQNLNGGQPLPYPDGAFDCILFTEVVEHLDPAGIPGLLTQLTRILRPGGIMIMTTPNRFSLNRYFFNPFRWNQPEVDAEGHGHWKEYRMSEMRKLFTADGLKLERSEMVSFYAHLGRCDKAGYFPLEQWRSHGNRLRNAVKIALRVPRRIPVFRDSLLLVLRRPSGDSAT